MPIYIDFHKLEGNPTEEDVRMAHQADLALQEQFGVKYLQYWFNEQASTVFCLIEGPNPDAVHTCHWSSHGNTPCNIQEVEPVYLKLFLGEGMPIDRDMMLNREGKADTAIRTLVYCEIRRKDFSEYKYSLVPVKAKNMVVDEITKFDGRFVEKTGHDALLGTFDSPNNAIRCAKNIRETIGRKYQKYGEDSEWDIDFRIALSKGQPLTEANGFFETAIKQVSWLCMVTRPNEILLSDQLKDLLMMERESTLYPTSLSSARVLTNSEVEFTYRLFSIIEQNIAKDTLNVSSLSELIGISRPQLYRKIMALTDKSPQHLIRDYRMRKAWELLKSKKANVSEVAYKVGFSSPSYFGKTFQKEYGFAPSKMDSV